MSSIAWAIAASDLGIRVTTPHMELDRHGHPIDFIAHIEDFGASAGTLVWYMPEPLPTSRLRAGVPYFVSVLNPNLYFDYDRRRFIALLSSWGWTGATMPPPWYTGQP